MSEGAMTPLQYIKSVLELSAKEFMAEWKTLTKEDQEQMKEWAIAESPTPLKLS